MVNPISVANRVATEFSQSKISCFGVPESTLRGPETSPVFRALSIFVNGGYFEGIRRS